MPSVAAVGRALARCGVTHVTDATATNDATSVAALSALPQRVRVMGPLDLVVEPGAGIELGEVKVLLDDDRLPALDETIALVPRHAQRRRGVAFHCVTLVQLRFAIEALRSAGVSGDRIEHASVAPPDAVAHLRELGVAVATQPGFVAARGDDYLRDVDPRDRAALYPLRSLIAAGVRTFGSSDAPYGPLDPWTAIRAAVERRTASGAVVGAGERIGGRAALALFGSDRPVDVGGAADFVLLALPLAGTVALPAAAAVRLTIIGGRVVYGNV